MGDKTAGRTSVTCFDTVQAEEQHDYPDDVSKMQLKKIGEIECERKQKRGVNLFFAIRYSLWKQCRTASNFPQPEYFPQRFD